MDWFEFLLDKKVNDKVIVEYLVLMKDDFQQHLDSFNERVKNPTEGDKLIINDTLMMITSLQSCIINFNIKSQFSATDKEFLSDILKRKLKDLRGGYSNERSEGLADYLQIFNKTI